MAPREPLGTDPDYLREHQYKDPTNLNARIALHAKYARSAEPWYPWLIGRVEWTAGARALEVGCGSGALWVNVASILPGIRLTLTDLSDGMVEAAQTAVARLPNIELEAARTCDAQDLPFDDASFDVVVANHMLYHVPDPALAASEFARVLAPGGVLMAATNGPRHLDTVRELSRAVFGGSSLDGAIQRFGPENGARILATAFGSVDWNLHPSTLVCTDTDDVYAFIASSPTGQEATPDQLALLRRTIAECFVAAGGSLPITTEAGCLVARAPARAHAR